MESEFSGPRSPMSTLTGFNTERGKGVARRQVTGRLESPRSPFTVRPSVSTPCLMIRLTPLVQGATTPSSRTRPSSALRRSLAIGLSGPPDSPRANVPSTPAMRRTMQTPGMDSTRFSPMSTARSVKEVVSDHTNRMEILNLQGPSHLVELLKSKDLRVQCNAAGALFNCALTLDTAIEIRRCGGLQLLVSVLSSLDLESQANAAGALMNCAAQDGESRKEIAELEGLRILLGLFASPSEIVRTRASGAIFNCCLSSVNAVLFRSIGGIAPLISLLETENEELLANTLGILNCIVAWDEASRVEFRRHGGMPPLILALSFDSERVQKRASGSIMHLSKDEENRRVFRKLNGFGPLAALLSSANEDVVGNGAGAFFHLAFDAENAIEIRLLGILKELVHVLTVTQQLNVQIQVSGALMNCTAYDAPARSAVRELGGMPPLIRLLQLHKDSLLKHCTGTLFNCTFEEENRTMLRECHGLGPLVHLLSHPIVDVHANAVGCVRNCAEDEAARKLLHGMDVIPELLRLLDSNSEIVLGRAAGALYNQSFYEESQPVIRLRRGLPALIKLFAAGSGPPRPYAIQADAAGVLMNMCRSDVPSRASMRSLDAIYPLTFLLSAPHEESSRRACWTLAFASMDEETACVIRREGAIKSLVGLLSAHTPVNVRRAATGCIYHLVAVDHESRLECLRHETVRAMLLMLSTPEADIQADSLGVIFNLSFVESGSVAIRAGDALPAILALLSSSKHTEVIANALGVLCNVLANDSASRAIVNSLGGIKSIVRHLASMSTACQSRACAALANAAYDPNCKAALVDAGGLRRLVMLLGSNDSWTVAHAATSLMNLAADDEGIRQAVLALDMLPAALKKLPASLPTIQSSGGDTAMEFAVARAIAGCMLNVFTSVEVVGQALASAGDLTRTILQTTSAHLEDAGDDVVLANLVGLIGNMAVIPAGGNALRSNGAIPRLLSICHNAASFGYSVAGSERNRKSKLNLNEDAVVNACVAIANMCLLHENQREVREQDGLPSLVSLCAGQATARVAAAASQALAALADKMENGSIWDVNGNEQMSSLLDQPVELRQWSENVMESILLCGRLHHD